MNKQESDSGKKGDKPDNKSSKQNLTQLKTDSPMGKFNDALRKILSVPKKDIKKK